MGCDEWDAFMLKHLGRNGLMLSVECPRNCARLMSLQVPSQPPLRQKVLPFPSRASRLAHQQLAIVLMLALLQTMDDFEMMKVLGKGTFGKVSLTWL